MGDYLRTAWKAAKIVLLVAATLATLVVVAVLWAMYEFISSG